MLFGDGPVKHASVPDGWWRVVSISHEVANEFLGMLARTCLDIEKNEVDVWGSVKFVLLCFFGQKSWFCDGC